MSKPEPIRIVVSGKPVSKGRGRAAVNKHTGRAMIFTPASTRKWENDARQVARSVMAGRPPLQAPLQIVVKAVFPISSSWPSWKREAALDGRLGHTSKPDGDNVLKAMKDALNGVVYADDSQVVRSGVTKSFGEAPSVTATITILDLIPSSAKSKPQEV